ncbi:MAG: hypothetical protein WBQ25_01750 [Nitrososphaeraceae archaeon]
MTKFKEFKGNSSTDLDKLSNMQRMKIAIREMKTYRRLNSPDSLSLSLIDGLINQLGSFGLTEQEIRYAINRVYSKRVRAYEYQDKQLPTK